uniref:Uncharacterized protein n=1 Tax=Oncorhynchus kisutch TaxID=8019 RepID=A0A8C7J3H9_ONCKI
FLTDHVFRPYAGLCVLELFHFVTLAFKDLAMTCTLLVGEKGHFGQHLVCLRDRSGEGGKLQVPRRTHQLQSEMVHPHRQCGNSDCPIRPSQTFTDAQLRASLIQNLNLIHSVNRSPVMMQLAHFLYAYLHVGGLKQAETRAPILVLEMIVPTGGAGNIAAGSIVNQIGIPLHLVAMTNANGGSPSFGDFSMATHVMQTLAQAIDIQHPYKRERVFWLLSGRDGALVKGMWEEFLHSHRYTLPEALNKHIDRCPVPLVV